MSEKVKVVNSGGIGFWSLLAIVLIALKLTGHIQISWWIIVGCVFAPVAIALSILAVSAVAVLAFAVIGTAIDYVKPKGGLNE